MRSSASTETLRERGAFLSHKLTADFGEVDIRECIRKIYGDFLLNAVAGSIAIIVQPLVAARMAGHISNERRVSKTINQWSCEIEFPKPEEWKRFNSQRSRAPRLTALLAAQTIEEVRNVLQSVGRWSSQLGKGPCHLEWCWDGNALSLLQIDFEDEMADDGVDPRMLLRTADIQPVQKLKQDSYLRRISLNAPSSWPKIENARLFASIRKEPFPNLFRITGDKFPTSKNGEQKLAQEIDAVTSGRAVCRTDCRSAKVQKLNLPRTDSVNGPRAVRFIKKAIRDVRAKGAHLDEICFIIHRFIPALSAAWSLAAPGQQIVVIDSLWGVPDGLQYLSHDSFEFDTKRKQISSERTRFKSAYIQETASGRWEEKRVKRSLARQRSISLLDIEEIAHQSLKIANEQNTPVQIMWFCGIPSELGIGTNLPWFRMGAAYPKRRGARLAPGLRRIEVRDEKDIERLVQYPPEGGLLALHPDVNLIRQDKRFLNKIISIATAHDLPVEVHGSALCHAFYLLERANVTVISADAPSWQRTRGKKKFGKLVRDQIPIRIEQGGEEVRLAKIAKHEARAGLIIKLFEEVQELREARGPEEVQAELADVLEAVKSISSVTGVSWKDVQKIAEEKRKSRGSFERGTVLLETSWPRIGLEARSNTGFIALKQLGQILSFSTGAEISYTSLLAPGGTTTFKLPSGAVVRVALTKSGVRIEEVSEEELGSTQLSLPLDLP